MLNGLRYNNVKKQSILFNILLVFVLTLIGQGSAYALSPDTYATDSRLAEGNWVKVSVSSSGMHSIPVATLREWGFSDPSKVRVYGYGGARIPDLLDSSTYVDDLPQVQTITLKNGAIAFYATGPVTVLGPVTVYGKPPQSLRQEMFTHSLNPWSTVGYYFLTDSDAPLREIPLEGSSAAAGASSVLAYAFHELDRVSPGQSGHLLVGEDFRYSNRNTFSIDMPGREEGTDVDIRTCFFSKISSGMPSLAISANNIPLGGADSLPISDGEGSWGISSVFNSRATQVKGNRLNLTLSLNSTGVTRLANLDYIGVTYTRALSLSGLSDMTFTTDKSELTLSGATDNTLIWDVTDPLSVKQINVPSAASMSWSSPYIDKRTYAAFNQSGTFPTPAFVGRVENQNIHAEPVPDMVIVTSGAMRQQAERIAEFHRNSEDAMRVFVVNKDKVWNEFGSGVADINAVRRMLKMFYDRGTDAEGHRLQFVLMMGRPFHDHRHLTEYMANGGYDNMPIWQTDAGSNESLSYCTDDVLAMLEDGSGRSLGSDRLCIAVGRISARTPADAKNYVDKLMAYHSRMPEGDWKNKAVILADDENKAAHLLQAESLIEQMQASQVNDDFVYNKVYIDAYEKINGVTEGARTQMYKWLNEGAMWWFYIGHASIDSWTTEGMLTRTDILNNLYFKRWPILYAATCTFSNWDGTEDSGAEMMVANSNGGVIASVCPVRPVFIDSNGMLTPKMGEQILQRDETGRFLPIGEIVRRGKNQRLSSDVNKLRYVINGDPAMRVPVPANRIVLESINDVAVDGEEQPIVKAHQQAKFKGYIADWQGNPLPNFNGTLHMTIYDAEESVTTFGRGDKDNSRIEVFERNGAKLFAGRDAIVNGRFEAIVSMPSEIAWNFRNALANMYAVSSDSKMEAIGCNRSFYVYGYDETAQKDEERPEISALYLNHESFKSGDVVNESPMMFAQVSDNVGINLSTAGIGHTLLMRLDDTEGYTDVSDYYTPNADGKIGGTVVYPINDLEPGNHKLTFRVWDTSNNVAQSSIEFYVQPGLAPEIFDVYTDCNPATTQANFYVKHNRPDAPISVYIEVFDLQGRPQWSGSMAGRSDMFVSTPITWNLTDMAGRRVPRGIYVYRATVTTDGTQHATASKRIAVAAE